MEYKISFSPNDFGYRHINQLIRNAEKSIAICVFTISDDRITDVIKDAYDRGVEVRIITDNEKLWDLGSDIKSLANHGIEIKVDETEFHMHHKFMVVDEQMLLTGSYNWTKTAAENNQENLLSLLHPEICQHYLDEFNRLWDKFNFLEDKIY